MILVLAGRRIDVEGAEQKRFPLSAVSHVREQLRKFLEANNISHLVSSGACGADLLAQELANELNIDRTIVLPFEPAVFRKTSVTDRPGNWGTLYDRLIKNAGPNLIILNYDPQDPQAYERTTVELLNTAERISTAYKKRDIVTMIVWEGQAKNKNDVSSGLREEAKRRSFETIEINTLN